MTTATIAALGAKVWTLTVNDKYGNATWLLTTEQACKNYVWKYISERGLDELPDEMPDDFGELLDCFYQYYDDADICWEELEVTDEAH